MRHFIIEGKVYNTDSPSDAEVLHKRTLRNKRKGKPIVMGKTYIDKTKKE
jgi:hypothetical protein